MDPLDLWRHLGGDEDQRRAAIAHARDDAWLRGAMLEKLFTKPDARFLSACGARFQDLDAIADYQEASGHLWQSALPMPPAALAGVYVSTDPTGSSRWLHFHSDGIAVTASVKLGAGESLQESATNVRRWLDIASPSAFSAHNSVGVWDLQGAAVRLVSVVPGVSVIYQGYVVSDGRVLLSALSLYNGHRSTRWFQPAP